LDYAGLAAVTIKTILYRKKKRTGAQKAHGSRLEPKGKRRGGRGAASLPTPAPKKKEGEEREKKDDTVSVRILERYQLLRGNGGKKVY